MQWIGPSEKDTSTETLENRLWAAADQLRANSGLTSAQYSTPVLGLIFLRFADVRFAKRRATLEKTATSARRGSRMDDPAAYHAEGCSISHPTPASTSSCICQREAMPARRSMKRCGTSRSTILSWRQVTQLRGTPMLVLIGAPILSLLFCTEASINLKSGGEQGFLSRDSQTRLIRKLHVSNVVQDHLQESGSTQNPVLTYQNVYND